MRSEWSWKNKVSFSGLRDYKTSHLVWHGKDGSFFSLTFLRFPPEGKTKPSEEPAVHPENKWFVCVPLYADGSWQQTVSSWQKFKLCSVGIRKCTCNYFSFVFSRAKAAGNSIFSVRHWKSLVNYWNNSVLFVPLMLHS